MTKSPYQIEAPQEQAKKPKVPFRIARRERRNPMKTAYNNNRKPKGTGFLNMGIAWDGRAIYQPKRKKLKGYMKGK
jgi:hypothetical protein